MFFLILSKLVSNNTSFTSKKASNKIKVMPSKTVHTCTCPTSTSTGLSCPLSFCLSLRLSLSRYFSSLYLSLYRSSLPRLLLRLRLYDLDRSLYFFFFLSLERDRSLRRSLDLLLLLDLLFLQRNVTQEYETNWDNVQSENVKKILNKNDIQTSLYCNEQTLEYVWV